MQFLWDVWQIWTYKLKYWCLLGFVLQTSCVALFVWFISLAIYNQESKLKKLTKPF